MDPELFQFFLAGGSVVEESTRTDFIGKFKAPKYKPVPFPQNSDFEIQDNPDFDAINTIHHRFRPSHFKRQAAHYQVPATDIFVTEYVTAQCGQYRIQNLAAEGYLIYVGVVTPPDFTQAASDFTASLPLVLSWPLPASGLETLYVVARYRDSYGCISQNSYPTIIVLSPTGRVFNPLPTPQEVIAYPQPNTNIAIAGQDPTYSMEDHPANKVNVWVDTVPPDTTTVPTYQGTLDANYFRVAFGTYAPGLYYVAVAFYRTSDSAQSGIVSTTVTMPDIPGAPSAVFTDNVTP